MNLLGWPGARGARSSRVADKQSPAPEALVDAYEKYAAQIYRFAYRRLGNRDDAQDVTAQVFLKATRSFDPSFDEDARRAWLYRAARTAIVDVWRSYGEIPAVPLDWYTEDSPAIDRGAGDAADRVERVLAQLNPVQRKVLELRFLGGRSLQETARELGMTEGNVKVVQHRALRRAAELAGGKT